MPTDEPPPPSEPGTKERRHLPSEVIDAAADGMTRLGRLNPAQVMTIFAILSLGFICSLQAFQVYADREDRKAAVRERQEAASAVLRENNAQVELARQHCQNESRDLRAFFDTQNEKRLRFEAEERSKDRAVLTALAARIADLERASGKRGGE